MLAFGASAPGEGQFMTEVAHGTASESCQAIDRRELPYYCGLTSARWRCQWPPPCPSQVSASLRAAGSGGVIGLSPFSQS
jgi:predicted alpha/beta-hydrolase family hydrolase